MFTIDVMSREPVYEQIVQEAERMILLNLLNAGDLLPSVRSLSVELSINPNTIQKAYAELDKRGLVQSVPGRGSFVAPGARESIQSRKRGELSTLERLLKELHLAGISRQEIEQAVDGIYRKQEGETL